MMVEEQRYDWMEKAVTLSIGVATFPKVGAVDYEGLFQLADQAMYKAKVSGKNRVVEYEPS